VKHLAFAATLAISSAWAFSAQAYCLTRGCTDKQQCDYEGDCLMTGPVLHWASSCVSFDVQRDGSPLVGIAYEDAHREITSAFTKWLKADCGDGATPAITITDLGPVECREAEYNQDSPNANVFMFRDEDWPYTNSVDTIALTTLMFNANNGEIYDADVEINSAQTPSLTVGKVGPFDIDFASVVTHEAGHFLGLSHSDSFGSTMLPSYGPGQTEMASLEWDDEQGVCAALPPDRKTKSDSCEPRHGFGSECALPATCGFAPARAGSQLSLASSLLALLGLSSTLLRRKSRPSSRRP
jgi:Matrixin